MKKSTLCFAATAALILSVLPLSACNKDKSSQGKTSKYSISAQYDDTNCVLSGCEEFTFYNSTDNEIAALEFNLWGNAYREGASCKPISEAQKSAYYVGASYGQMDVEKVENCASWEVCGEDMTILSVTLNTPVYPEQSVTVNITYTLKPAKVNHRTGITSKTVNLGNFYPVLCAYGTEGFVDTPYYSCGDPFVSDCADYDVTLTLPEGYTAATSGKQVSTSTADGKVTQKYAISNARDFAVVLSNGYKSVTKSVNGCEITAYYFGETAPEKAIDAACDSFGYFSEKFGAYPYSTFTLAFTPLSVSGMEYPALVMINDTLEEADGVYTAVHETAHQWWYAVVGNDQVNCAFMDEGLAEYSCLSYFEAHPEHGFTRTGLIGSAIKSYRAYYSVYNQIFGKTDTSMERSLKDFAGDYEYINVAYNKSLLMFENVRASMGDKKFFAALSEYYSCNKFKIASKEELISRFARRHDVEGLINGYIEGKVVI